MWRDEVLQMIVELKQSLAKVTDTDAAWKQINCFTNNQDRMDYGRYRAAGWPIGSRLVEGQCKFLVARRLKGNGMRWRPHDNRCVLRTRLALLNGDLKSYFSPPADCETVAACQLQLPLLASPPGQWDRLTTDRLHLNLLALSNEPGPPKCSGPTPTDPSLDGSVESYGCRNLCYVRRTNGISK